MMASSDDAGRAPGPEPDGPVDNLDEEDIAQTTERIRANLGVARAVDDATDREERGEAEQAARLRELTGPVIQALRSTAEDDRFWRVLRRGGMGEPKGFAEYEPLLDALGSLPWGEVAEQLGADVDDFAPDLENILSELPHLMRQGGTRGEVAELRISLRLFAGELERAADLPDIQAQRLVRRGGRVLARVSLGAAGALLGAAVAGPFGLLGGGAFAQMFGEEAAKAAAGAISEAAREKVEEWLEDPSPGPSAFQNFRNEAADFANFVHALVLEPEGLGSPEVQEHGRRHLERMRLGASGAWVWVPRRTARRSGLDDYFRSLTAAIDQARRTLADLPVRTDDVLAQLQAVADELHRTDAALLAALTIHGG